MRQYAHRKRGKADIAEQAVRHEKVLRGAAASQLAEFAETELVGRQERGIRRDIFAQIDSPEPLDPLKAAQAWIELRAVYKLVEGLKRVQKDGIVSSSRLDLGLQEADQDRGDTA
jgi:hypothetical protein